MIESAKIRQKEREFITEKEFGELVNDINQPVVRTTVQTMFYTRCIISKILNLKGTTLLNFLKTKQP